jgi:hypothetical protein
MADTPSPHLTLVQIAGLLNSLKRDYALVGGLAVSGRDSVSTSSAGTGRSVTGSNRS